MARHDLERAPWVSEHRAHVENGGHAQQTTALHMTASSRKILFMSFSSAKDRLLPSVGGEGEVSEGSTPARTARLTDDERELLKVAGVARVLDRLETLREKVLRVVRVDLVDDDLWECGLGQRRCAPLPPPTRLTRLIDSEIRRHESPMLMAVS